jgi:hypothetical protein
MLWKTAFALTLLVSTTALADDVMPSATHWGASISATKAALIGKCDTMKAHRADVTLDGVTRQAQIDCEGFMYQGKARHAEFVLGDDQLEMVRITADASDEAALGSALKAEYGAPDHSDGVYDGFSSGRAALRHDTHQVVFYSPHAEQAFEAGKA